MVNESQRAQAGRLNRWLLLPALAVTAGKGSIVVSAFCTTSVGLARHLPLAASLYNVSPLHTCMEKNTVTPASHMEMIRHYPITGLVEGWYFREDEISAGCYIVEASDLYGRKISRASHGAPGAALAECVKLARQSRQ